MCFPCTSSPWHEKCIKYSNSISTVQITEYASSDHRTAPPPKKPKILRYDSYKFSLHTSKQVCWVMLREPVYDLFSATTVLWHLSCIKWIKCRPPMSPTTVCAWLQRDRTNGTPLQPVHSVNIFNHQLRDSRAPWGTSTTFITPFSQKVQYTV